MSDSDRGAQALALCTVLAVAASGCTGGDGQGGQRSQDLPMSTAMHSGTGGAQLAGPIDAGAAPQAHAGDTATGLGADAGMPRIGGADAGTFTPRADLDPGVTFDWQETTPGLGKCQEGTYTGTFQCEFAYDDSLGLFPPDAGSIVVSGPITLHFQKSADGEFLELADAQLEGVAQDFFGFTADLDGQLDCTTLELTAQAQNGEYGLGLPIGIPLGTVEGTLDGTLDAQSGELQGQWSLSAGMGVGTCTGPWQASFTP